MRISDNVILNKKGISFIIAIAIAAIVILIVMAVLPQAFNERQASKRWADSIRAFYAAESGINRAIWALNNYEDDIDWTNGGWVISGDTRILSLQPLNNADGNTIAYYEIEVDLDEDNDPATEDPAAESTGYSPNINGAKRSIKASMKKDAAITARGGVVLKGNATVNGEIRDYAEFSFENIFGQSKEGVKGAADTKVITDPENNYGPIQSWIEDYVDTNGNGLYDLGEPFTDDNGNGICDEYNITWFELINNSQAMITEDGWTGGGLLVVEGGDLKITGGTFNGVIWVMGNLYVAGNASITGALFVDGTVEDITTISGTPNITYNESEIIDAFGIGINPIEFWRATWREIYK